MQIFRTTIALAALSAVLGPAASFAGDTAPAAVQAQVAAPAVAVAKAAPAPVVAAKPALPTPVYKADDYKESDVWSRIRSGYAIPDVNNSLVTKHVNWYATRPDYVARTS